MDGFTPLTKTANSIRVRSLETVVAIDLWVFIAHLRLQLRLQDRASDSADGVIVKD